MLVRALQAQAAVRLVQHYGENAIPVVEHRGRIMVGHIAEVGIA